MTLYFNLLVLVAVLTLVTLFFEGKAGSKAVSVVIFTGTGIVLEPVGMLLLYALHYTEGESSNKPLNDEDFSYYGRMSRCIAGWQVCTLVTLYCMDRLDYFYAGYSSIVLVVVFLILF